MPGEPVILARARTPIGRYGGALAHVRTDDLLGLAMTAACERAAIVPGCGGRAASLSSDVSAQIP